MAPANPENDCTGKQRVISVESGEAVQVKSQVRFATYLKTWEWNTVFLSYNFILNQTPSVEMALFVLVYCCFFTLFLQLSSLVPPSQHCVMTSTGHVGVTILLLSQHTHPMLSNL